ncbi:MAG: 16S rRNA processing protein RimM [Flavobacteriaceae bacterium]|nr:MAG: 16S rRNA processing protein RimM [Flavobacteriaceae bacterium]
MHKKDCFYLGKIVRKHSFRGEVVIKLDTDEPGLYQNLESVFVLLGGNLIPFFIEESLLQKGNQLRVRFEDVDSEEDADNILGSGIYMPLTMLPKLEGNKFYFHEVIGFEVEDVNEGSVGIIDGINDSTAQALFEIKDGDTEILIPMIDEFIVKIDREHKKVVVKTPVGLIAMYKDI